MALPLVIQGSWEEIAAHAGELGDRSDLLLIVPARSEETNGAAGPTSLPEAMQGYVGSSDYGGAHLSEQTGRKFAELLARKHRDERS